MNNGIKVAIWIFGILAFLDMLTAYINSKYIILLEMNPLYLVFKSLLPIVILNIALGFFLYYIYKRRTINYRFFVMNVVCWQAVARIYAIYHAINIMILQPEVTQIIETSAETKATTYSFVILFIMIIPFIVTQTAFWLFKKDHLILKR